MNKAQLVKELSKECKLTQKDCNDCLTALTTLVQRTLRNGDNINLVGFGKFEVKHRNSRKTYNLQTKRNIIVPASKTPYFKPGKTFKSAIS